MNQQDLQNVGNALFERKINQPSLEQRDQASPSKLGVESFINNNDVNVDIFRQTNQKNCPPYPHQKCVKAIKARWDKFYAYSFHKLDDVEKDRTFLQLYQDFQQVKSFLNEQIAKNIKLQSKLQMKQAEIIKLKAMSPAQRNRYEKQKNVQSKTQVDSLKQQIKRLHQKIIALTNNKNVFSTRPSSSKGGKQKIITTTDQNIKQQLQNERKTNRELLLIIDELKKNKFIVEQQLKYVQSNSSQVRAPAKNQSKVVGRGNTQSQFNQFAGQLHIWKEKCNDLQLAYNKMNQDKQRVIKQLSAQIITLKQNQRMRGRQNRKGEKQDNSNRLEDQIHSLKHQKQRLQNQLVRLVKIPFYQDNKQIYDAQQKINTVQAKYNKMKQQLAKLNQTNSKNFAELQFKIKQNAMLKTQNQKFKKQIKQNMEKQYGAAVVSSDKYINQDDYYRKKLRLVELQGNDPVWKKYQSLAKPQINKMTEQTVRALAQTLWINKIQLLAHIEKAQTQLNTLKDGMNARINIFSKQNQVLHQQLKIARARLDQWRSMESINQRKPYKVFQQAGIKYDDTISVFQIQETQIKSLDSNQNYFDLYLGHLNIDESVLMKNPQNKIKNTSHFISFLTIDFYNHETQHSNFAQGVMKKLGNNYSFKVQVNSPFLKYLSKKTMSLQLWSPQGTATILLGKGQIFLSEIITRSSQDISSVIRGKCQIYSNQKNLIATVQYRLRMRLPISPFIEWAQNKNEFKSTQAKDPFALGKRKMLQISVLQAEGLPAGMNAFVYFNVQQQDYFSHPQRGPTAYWNFVQDIQVTMDQEFTDELKQKYFQFTIFDDDKEVSNDVYGIAKANFTPLIQDTDSLDLNLDIEDIQGTKKGKIKIQAKWLDM